MAKFMKVYLLFVLLSLSTLGLFQMQEAKRNNHKVKDTQKRSLREQEGVVQALLARVVLAIH